MAKKPGCLVSPNMSSETAGVLLLSLVHEDEFQKLNSAVGSHSLVQKKYVISGPAGRDMVMCQWVFFFFKSTVSYELNRYVMLEVNGVTCYFMYENRSL